jgi:hypothetical protein
MVGVDAGEHAVALDEGATTVLVRRTLS